MTKEIQNIEEIKTEIMKNIYFEETITIKEAYIRWTPQKFAHQRRNYASFFY